MIARPFVIRQKFPADQAKEVVIELKHENGHVALDIQHPMYPDGFGILLTKDTVEHLEAALMVLFHEMRDRHEYAVEQM